MLWVCQIKPNEKLGTLKAPWKEQKLWTNYKIQLPRFRGPFKQHPENPTGRINSEEVDFKINIVLLLYSMFPDRITVLLEKVKYVDLSSEWINTWADNYKLFHQALCPICLLRFYCKVNKYICFKVW